MCELMVYLIFSSCLQHSRELEREKLLEFWRDYRAAFTVNRDYAFIPNAVVTMWVGMREFGV